MIFSLRPEGIGDYTPEERHNVPWPSRTLGRIGCPSGAGTPNTAGGYRDRIYIGSLLGPDPAMNLSGLFFDPLRLGRIAPQQSFLVARAHRRQADVAAIVVEDPPVHNATP